MKKLVLALTLVASASAMANRESGGRPAASAVYVRFASEGNGFDANAEKVLKDLIREADAQHLILDRTFEQKGREGESLYCVHLDSAQNRHAFIAALAPSILQDRQSGANRTHVLVGLKCGEVDRATEQDLSKYLP